LILLVNEICKEPSCRQYVSPYHSLGPHQILLEILVVGSRDLASKRKFGVLPL
jgi:hypothetical protein